MYPKLKFHNIVINNSKFKVQLETGIINNLIEEKIINDVNNIQTLNIDR